MIQICRAFTQLLVCLLLGMAAGFCTDPTADFFSYPTFSPDGNRVAFAFYHRGKTAIFEAAQDGSKLDRLTSKKQVSTQPSYSPDGSQMVFVVEEPRFHYNIQVLDRTSGGCRALTTGTEQLNYLPRFSPDGTRIYFTRAKRFIMPRSRHPMIGWSGYYICSMKPDGTDVREHTSGGFRLIDSFSVSPDEKTAVACLVPDFSELDSSLWLLDLDGSEAPRPLSPRIEPFMTSEKGEKVGELDLRFVNYFPSGKSVLFYGPSVQYFNQDGKRYSGRSSELYRLNLAEGTRLEQLTTGQGTIWEPRLSDDGSKIVYVTPPNWALVNELWTVDSEGLLASRVPIDPSRLIHL